MQFYKKQMNFFGDFAQFLKSTSNFESFWKKMTLITYVFLKVETAKEVVS